MDAVLGIAFMIAFGGFGIWMNGRERRKRLAVLEQVARRRGGRVEPNIARDAVVVDVPGATIRVWIESSKNYTATVWRAAVEHELPEFRIARADFAGRVSAFLGAQDRELGYRTDRDTIVKAADVALVKRVWSEQHVLHLLNSFSECWTEDRHTLMLERDRGFESPGEIEEGIDFLAELVGIDDVFGRAALRALPDASDQGDYVVIAGPGDIRIGPEQGSDGITRTVARSTAMLAGAVPRELASKLGAGELVDEPSGACVRWPSIETDAQALVAAIQLLRALSQGPSLGAFR